MCTPRREAARLCTTPLSPVTSDEHDSMHDYRMDTCDTDVLALAIKEDMSSNPRCCTVLFQRCETIKRVVLFPHDYYSTRYLAE